VEALERLRSDSPETREKAFQELKKMGKSAVPALKAALPGLKDPDVKARVGELLRVLDPAAMEALDAYLSGAKIEVGAIDIVKDPALEKASPRVLVFQVWKRGEARVWKLLGFDREKGTLADWSEEPPDLGAEARERLKAAATASHASIAAYPGAPSLLASLERPALRVWVKGDGHRVEARSLEGAPLWVTELAPKVDVGAPLLRLIKASDDQITLVLGKHTYLSLDAATGKLLGRASD
jgi:hypothetical protein